MLLADVKRALGVKKLQSFIEERENIVIDLVL
jgi:hypothetical protein